MENNIIENELVENLLKNNSNEVEQNMLIEVEKMQDEVRREVTSIDQGIFWHTLIVTVIILMIFEGILNYFKDKKETENEKEKMEYKKRIRITLIIYIIYLVIYFLITHFALKIPAEIAVTFIVVSTLIMLSDVFLELPFLKKFKKK